MPRSVLVSVLLMVAASAQAQTAVPPTDSALDQQFRAEVAAKSEEAATAYDEANAARAAQRFDEAAAAYRKAIELAPDVAHPHRRLCSVLAAQGKANDALDECETAYRLAPESPYNKAALAAALMDRNQPGDLARGATLAAEAREALPDDVSTVQIRCRALMMQSDSTGLESCVDHLLRLEPDGLVGNFLGALVAGEHGDYDLARLRLRKAKAAGLDPRAYEEISSKLDDVEDSTATFPRPARTAFWLALWVIGIWLAVLLALLIAGTLLSRATLRSVSRGATSTSDGTGTEHERKLRRIYKAVLLLSGVYFYLSIPVMLATIVAAGCGAVLLFMAMGVIPVKLVVVIAIVVLGTVGAILRSLFVRSRSEPPGEKLDLDKHPRLRALLSDVAQTIGTRPIDAAYLTPGTDMAVTERAGVWKSLRGARTERSLIMGVGLFEGMTQLQLRSILAHEHGHFRNEDTAGGGFALAVRRSLFTLILRLAHSGVATAWNPVWWFVRGFHRMYLGISQGASRLQEVLADRWAIRAYGSEAFIAGYKHVVVRSVAFDHDADDAIKEAIEKHRPLPNLYTYEPESNRLDDNELDALIEKEMVREPTAYDSHPSPRQRIEWATQLAHTRAAAPDDDAPVWNLFDDREAVERQMTARVRDSIHARHGIEIAASAESAEPVESAASDT